MLQQNRSTFLYSFLLLVFASLPSSTIFAQNIKAEASFSEGEWVERSTPIFIEFDRELTNKEGRPPCG